MMKAEFVKKVKAHDWYYDYSDDHGRWRRGREELEELRTMHTRLKCPYALTELQRWHHKAVKNVTFFESLDEPGLWYKDPRPKYAAPAVEHELIDEETYNKITEWAEGANNG